MKNSKNFPVKCKHIDRYTIIVPDAKAAANFHCNVLGFRLLTVLKTNAGTAKEGEYDLLNYVLAMPNNPARLTVLAEGLTKDSVFQRYMRKFGKGIHHIDLEVDSAAVAYRMLRNHGIRLTGEHTAPDNLASGQQLLIENDYAGVFIGLVDKEVKESFRKNLEKAGASGLSEILSSYMYKSDDQISLSNTAVHAYTDDNLHIGTQDSFIIETENPDKAAEFMTDIFGFERVDDKSNEGIKLVLPADPDCRLIYRKKQVKSKGTSFKWGCIVPETDPVEQLLHSLGIEIERPEIMTGITPGKRFRIGPGRGGYEINISKKNKDKETDED